MDEDSAALEATGIPEEVDVVDDSETDDAALVDIGESSLRTLEQISI